MPIGARCACFLPYLWPADDKSLRWRIVVAAFFVLIAKAVVLTLPFAYAGAVDTMAAEGDPALWACARTGDRLCRRPLPRPCCSTMSATWCSSASARTRCAT